MGADSGSSRRPLPLIVKRWHMHVSTRQLSWIVAASLHFALVVCGAMYVPLTGDWLALNLLGQYGDISGSSSSYGFFAPAVASKNRVSLAVRDVHGHECGAALLADATSAAELRAGGIVDGFPAFSDAQRRGLTASWASAMFGRHPSAEEVVVCVEIEALPTMAEWRNGKRSTWIPAYQGTYRRKEHGERPKPAR
jgi:hypothetical protein